MDFENERYVRVYTRDTADLLAIGFEGRAVLWELIRKVDRAGVVEGDTDVLPEMLRVPREVFDVAWPKLLARGVVEAVTNRDGKLFAVVPNFVEAQEAKQSDKHRQRESRARRRDLARIGQLGVTERDNDDRIRDESSRSGHTVSHGVTPSLAVLSRAVPSRAVGNAPPPKNSSEPEPKIHDLAVDAKRLHDEITERVAYSPALRRARLRVPGHERILAQLGQGRATEDVRSALLRVLDRVEADQAPAGHWGALWGKSGDALVAKELGEWEPAGPCEKPRRGGRYEVTGDENYGEVDGAEVEL